MKSTLDTSFARTVRAFAALALVISLVAPMAIAADKKGEKNYKRGLQHEAAQQWEEAAQEFALAVAAKPSNIEFQLHYRRSIFNASQVFMQKGRSLSEREDYVGAYNAFRQAYGYDPVNQLALAEMERMLRLQREKDARANPGTNPTNTGGASGTSLAAQRIPASYTQNGVRGGQEPLLPNPTTEKLTTVNWNSDLEGLIRKLAAELDLNVVFDEQFSRTPRQISLNLRNVTVAQALDYVFQTRSLFFQKLGRRTILVADASKRVQYQQLALRTFYLKNAKPDDVQKMLPVVFPAQAGRGAVQAVPNATTNSVTVRDTPENLQVIEEVIRSIDKERAAIVFDVQIYEVTRTDMLQLGGQLGNSGNIGGTSGLLVPFGGNPAGITPRDTAGALLAIPTALATGIIIPPLQLSALQDKKNTRLLESTQLHAFDNEDVEQRIGRRVPVQTASYFPNVVGTTPNTNQGGFASGGFPVVNYEPTGLTIKFTKPQVFPSAEGDFDVQVNMRLESKDVIGAATATPTFSERSLNGTARIKNNRTLLLASVARNQEARGRQGLPLLGLIPILGRFISTPTRDDSRSDIVIAITPRVLRAPSIKPEDEVARMVGSMQTPLSDSLQAFVQGADREDQLARLNAAPQTQLPQAIAPQPQTLAQAQPVAQSNSIPASAPVEVATATQQAPNYVPAPRLLMPEGVAANSQLPILAPQLAALTGAPPPPAASSLTMTETTAAAKGATLSFVPEDLQLKPGERRQIMLMLDTQMPVNFLVATMKFDPKIIAVRNLTLGNFARPQSAAPELKHFVDPKGSVLATLATGNAPLLKGTGVLMVLEIEALSAGESRLELANDNVHFVAPDNGAVAKHLRNGRIVVAQQR